MRRETAPSWARIDPDIPTPCGICGGDIYPDDEYEATKPKGSKHPNFYHTACIKKERAKR